MGETCAISVASNLVSKLGESLISPIGHQFGYVLCYKSYVEDLKNGIKELETTWERVQYDVQEAENNGKPIYTDVENWLKSVKEETEKADNLLKCDKSAKNACFRGWLPNPMVRYPIGRKVKKITRVIQGLHEKSREGNFQKVYHENPPIGIVTNTTSAARFVDNKEDVLESRAKIMNDVMKAIVDDKFNVIGVYGPGGVGKSKLLEDIERQVKEEKLFDVVIMANVSRNPDLKEIQGEIAYALGLKLTNDEPARGRADRLCRSLEGDSKKKILVILDNLWKKLELKEVGIPCGNDNKVRDCKLLLTSRYRDVLRNDMASDRDFRVKELEPREAQRLFERTVGDKVNDPEFKHLVDGVVKNCGGLPLLIISLAKSLKHEHLAAWRTASTYIEGSEVKSLVELNYKDLKNERIRSLFLSIALNSGIIFERYSLASCMGLGLYKNFSKTLENARDRLIMDLRSLQDSSLLLDSHYTLFCKMHDIFVDEAISIAYKEWNALVGRKDYGFKEWSKDELKKCIAMVFRFIGIDELPGKLDCPNLRMLQLLENNPSLKLPESFFESMEKLQVLELGHFPLTTLPSSIQFLENLKSLVVCYCPLADVTILGKLKGLQFLNFLGSTIARLPKEIGELTELRFLDLTRCTKLKVIEPGVLGSLVNLEELYMGNSFDQWEAEDEALRSNASLAELRNMKKLSTLHISIPHSVDFSKDLPFRKLNRHIIQIGDIWNWLGKYEESRILKLKLHSSNLLLEEWVQTCLQRTEDLHLHGLPEEEHSIHDLCFEGFGELKHLHVQNCPSIQFVVHSAEHVQCTTFTRLESLFLKSLNNFEKISRGCLAPESFGKLKIVKVDDCDVIKHLFPLSMMRIFSQLEEIEISNCKLMQQIITNAVAEEDGDEIDDDPKVKSCNLRRLTLQNLAEMTSFYKTVDHSVEFFDGQQVLLPRLEILTLSKLPKLKKIWNSQFPSDLSNLKFLKVEDCAFLLCIIPSNLLIKLRNLEAITIERCWLIRDVFDLEGLTLSGEVEILSRLTRLTLSDLPRLRYIWNKNPRRALCLQNLRVLKVKNCENLRFLFSFSMAKELQQIKEIEVASCKLLEELIDVQEEESDEAPSINTIKFPQLTSLSLKELQNFKTFFYGTYHIHCPTLTRLTISGCPKMMTFSSFEEKQQSIDAPLQKAFGCINSNLSLPVFFNERVLFPSLEELKLSSMCELKRIWHDQFLEQSSKLASLTLELCENLSHVFPPNSIDRLQSLNEIKVVGCPFLEALFESVSLNVEERQKPLVLPTLKKVELLNLPRLRDISKSDYKVTSAFPSLMEVKVRRCHSLPYLFSSATAKTLDKLALLDVSCCNNLRTVIVMEEGKVKTVKTVMFRQLSTLKIGDLENFISFSLASCAPDGLYPLFDEKLAFPKLEELHIEGVQQEERGAIKSLWSPFAV
ncbi:disease resistance protein RPS2 [Eucalyptus grandis]|uniref:disease resistance protein RPS2 n=1 Tax=Eucalyptus grandis TaxID=71139 RepID=UPI00192EDBB4|nr:disease resistance protein RPS2 [Eucalyptus grandis]